MSGMTYAIARAPAPATHKPTRDRQIVAMLNEGHTLEAVGAHFGLTRERVWQIANARGVPPRRAIHAAKRQELSERVVALIQQRLPVKQVSHRVGVSDALVYAIAKETGTKIHRFVVRADILPALIERVRAGESIWSVSGQDRALASSLTYHCRKQGVASVHGRWRDFSARQRLIVEMRQDGATWAEIAGAVATAEGRVTEPYALHAWAVRHMDIPKRAAKARAKKAAKTRAPRQPRQTAPVPLIEGTPRQVCASYYGKASASQVAAALGITRNAVIGHWFRARKAGQIGEAA